MVDFCHRMCNVIHQRQYNVLLRFDPLFRFSKYAKHQQSLLDKIHGLTTKVIKLRKTEFAEKGDKFLTEREFQKKPEDDAKSDPKYQNLRYVRDDLDELEENDVGEENL